MSDAAPATRPGKKAAKAGGRLRHGADVAARAAAAILMGYVTASLCTAVLAKLLPGPVIEATMTATLISFAIYAGVAIWAFADPKTWRVWAGLAVGCGLLALALRILLTVEPRL